MRDAALLTLGVQRKAMQFGMSLKDASAYNVQFRRGRPALIDTLSFEARRPGPWAAYRQFCQHFYAPLLLSSSADPRLARVHIDGVPLDLASKLLPRRSYLRAGPLLHVHLHAKAERRFARRTGPRRGDRGGGPKTVDRGVHALVDSLERAITNTRWTPRSDWSSYYADQPSCASEAFAGKLDLVSTWLDRLRPGVVWDLGANTGRFSRVAARQAEPGQPVFRFVHFSVPHLPFVFGREGYDPPFDPLQTSPDTHYVRQLEYVDRLVGELAAPMRASGTYDAATIVLLADHGLRFGTRERDPLHIPFIAKMAWQRTRTDVAAPARGETLLKAVVERSCGL